MTLSKIATALILSFMATVASAQQTQQTRPAAGAAEAMVGTWKMSTEFQGQRIPATMVLELTDGELTGVWRSQGGEMKLMEIELAGETLRFARTMGSTGPKLQFEGIVDGDAIEGTFESPMGGSYPCRGERAASGEEDE